MINTQYSLMFHDVYEHDPYESGFKKPSSNSFKVSRSDFLKFLDDIALVMKEQGIPQSRVLYTFDDGGKSFLWIARELAQRGIVGRFFISTGYIGSDGFCSESDLLEIDRLGHILGTHSHSHPERLSKLDESNLKEEWVRSTLILERILDKPILEASIPGGAYSLSSANILHALGYKVVYTSCPTLRLKYWRDLSIVGRFTIRANRPITQYVNYIKRSSSLRREAYFRWLILELLKVVFGSSFFKARNVIMRF